MRTSLICILTGAVGLSFSWAQAPSQAEFEIKPAYINQTTSEAASSLYRLDSLSTECPPCNPFNCILPKFPCQNNGVCNTYNGQCDCPPGWGGEDCGKPLCGSLGDGKERYPRDGDDCVCKPGWTGLNCNVCESNESCYSLVPRDPLQVMNPSTSDDPSSVAVCYKEGFAVKEMYQMCDVTNRKILDMLPGRPPQVTFTCSTNSATCGFQFWIGKVESFYCGLQNCTQERSLTASASFDSGFGWSSVAGNQTSVTCETVSCACIPGRMLCGENGSVDISEFLAEEIKGPGKFSSISTNEGARAAKFEEPAMNDLIESIFGDVYITLSCGSGECIRADEVPGVVPRRPNNQKWVVVSIIFIAVTLLAGMFLFWHFGRNASSSFLTGRIKLDDQDDSEPLIKDHIPATLQWASLSYKLPTDQALLTDISGSVKPGEIMAIIGTSGAGKSTLLDLLAKKDKSGRVKGDIFVNGKRVSDVEYRRVVGYVDQEDTLMPTLTVYETILYSALLRLPREMSLEDKKERVLETMYELGILGIRDNLVGGEGKRGISGGEKRRVSIACELVTSPSILFLDEPTSGLDSYNAYNVVECLVQLARSYKRTVIFTIHQPRSNIVALFDKLLLLARGRMLYSGLAKDCQQHFASAGWECPPGFNFVDYLIDLTMQDEKGSTTIESALLQLSGESDATPINANDLENGPSNTKPSFIVPSNNGSIIGGTELRPTHLSISTLDRAFHSPQLPSDKVQKLVKAFIKSEHAKILQTEIADVRAEAGVGSPQEDQETILRPYKRAGWWAQFSILSERCFKNLYRNPMLMLSHYVVSVVVALLCAFLFKNVTNDISGFQNRMGLFFFCLALFGFGCLTTLNSFAAERHLFTRERANGYYSPATWFAAKVLFDVIPLRVIPPFILGAIVYGPVGLVPTVGSFWRFNLVLILFNLCASGVVMFLGVLINNSGVANLVGSLVMLFNLLFAGLLINRDKLPQYLQWLETTSFFHAAFEALLVNEVRYLQLTDHRYGVDIEVPAATILSIFGFKAQAFWCPDVSLLVALWVAFIAMSFVALVVLVKERR